MSKAASIPIASINDASQFQLAYANDWRSLAKKKMTRLNNESGQKAIVSDLLFLSFFLLLWRNNESGTTYRDVIEDEAGILCLVFSLH